MSKQSTVVSNNTVFNTVVDAKISRKELVDMILEEQEANLEDAIEKAREKYQAANKVLQAATKNGRDVVEKAMLGTSGNKTLLKDAKKLFKAKYDVEIASSVNFDLYYDNCDQNGKYYEDGKTKLTLQLQGQFSLKLYKKSNQNQSRHRHSSNNIEISSLSKAQMLKLKGVKAEVKKLTDARTALDKAEDEYNAVQETYSTFRKKGKRARSAFVRQLMSNTAEGQEVLSQLDAIKRSTQKLLK